MGACRSGMEDVTWLMVATANLLCWPLLFIRLVADSSGTANACLWSLTTEAAIQVPLGMHQQFISPGGVSIHS